MGRLSVREKMLSLVLQLALVAGALWPASSSASSTMTAMTSTVASAAPSKAVSTFAAVRAKAPKGRAARRAAFLAFGRSDRAALDERRAALREALGLADRTGENSARATIRLLLAALDDVAGDGTTARNHLARAAADGPANIRRFAWVNDDDEARAVVAALKFDDDVGAARAPSDLGGLRSAAAAWRARRAAGKGRSAPPAGSLFALRRSLADVVSDEHRGLLPAMDDAKVRAGLLKRLAPLGALRGPRETAAQRALALEVRAALFLVDGRRADAAVELLRADRLRALDPVVDVGALPSAVYAGTARTRAFCAAVEASSSSSPGGPVSCDAIEQQKLGGVTFVDASRGPERAFSPEEAQQVLGDYDVLLQRCLKQGAKDNLTNQTVVQLEWGIGNDGVVKGHDLRPMRLRGTSVERCLEEALGVFRFQRYPGEMQHLRIDFEVGGEL